MLFDELRPEALLDEEVRQHEKRAARNVEERSHRIEENIVEARPPAIRPDMTEGGDDAVGDNWPEIGRDAGEGIEADRPLDVGRVDVDEVSGAGFGNMRKHVFCKIAVRIEQCQALAGEEVLPDQVEKKSALAGAGLADH